MTVRKTNNSIAHCAPCRLLVVFFRKSGGDHALSRKQAAWGYRTTPKCHERHPFTSQHAFTHLCLNTALRSTPSPPISPELQSCSSPSEDLPLRPKKSKPVFVLIVLSKNFKSDCCSRSFNETFVKNVGICGCLATTPTQGLLP